MIPRRLARRLAPRACAARWPLRPGPRAFLAMRHRRLHRRDARLRRRALARRRAGPPPPVLPGPMPFDTLGAFTPSMAPSALARRRCLNSEVPGASSPAVAAIKYCAWRPRRCADRAEVEEFLRRPSRVIETTGAMKTGPTAPVSYPAMSGDTRQRRSRSRPRRSVRLTRQLIASLIDPGRRGHKSA